MEDPSATVQDEDNVGLRSEDAGFADPIKYLDANHAIRGQTGSRLPTSSRPTPSHRQATLTISE